MKILTSSASFSSTGSALPLLLLCQGGLYTVCLGLHFFGFFFFNMICTSSTSAFSKRSEYLLLFFVHRIHTSSASFSSVGFALLLLLLFQGDRMAQFFCFILIITRNAFRVIGIVGTNLFGHGEASSSGGLDHVVQICCFFGYSCVNLESSAS